MKTYPHIKLPLGRQTKWEFSFISSFHDVTLWSAKEVEGIENVALHDNLIFLSFISTKRHVPTKGRFVSIHDSLPKGACMIPRCFLPAFPCALPYCPQVFVSWVRWFLCITVHMDLCVLLWRDMKPCYPMSEK